MFPEAMQLKTSKGLFTLLRIPKQTAPMTCLLNRQICQTRERTRGLHSQTDYFLRQHFTSLPSGRRNTLLKTLPFFHLCAGMLGNYISCLVQGLRLVMKRNCDIVSRCAVTVSQIRLAHALKFCCVATAHRNLTMSGEGKKQGWRKK